MNPEVVKAWLESKESGSIFAGLHNLSVDMIDEKMVNLISGFLISDYDKDIIFASIQVLKKAAQKKIDISPSLPFLQRLFEDRRFPSHLPMAKNIFISIGGEAASAFAIHHFRQGNTEELQELINRSDLLGWAAINTLRSANTPSEIEPFLPLLKKILAGTFHDEIENKIISKKEYAAMVLAKYYWLKKEWKGIEELIHDKNEKVRLGAITTIENLAEMKKDIYPLLETIISVFDRSDSNYQATRVAAARIFVSLIFSENPKAKSFVRAGVDLMKIPEVKKEIEEIKQFAKKFRNDR